MRAEPGGKPGGVWGASPGVDMKLLELVDSEIDNCNLPDINLDHPGFKNVRDLVGGDHGEIIDTEVIY